MPDLSLNYAETPPWLKNDAQESTFLRDVEAGQRINSQRQQLPLKLKALQQDAQMNELKISEHIRQRDDLLRAEQEAQGLGETIAPLLDQEQPDKAMSALLAAGIRKPILFKSPQWQTMMKEVQASVTAQRAQKQLDSLNEYRRAQEEGKNLRAEDTNQTRLEIAELRNQLANDPDNIQNLVKITNLYARLESLQQGRERLANDTEKISQSERRLTLDEQRLVQQGRISEARLSMQKRGAELREIDQLIQQYKEGVELAPAESTATAPAGTGATTSAKPALIPVARPTTPATVTVTQESLRNLSNSYDAVQRTRQMVESTPGAFGPLGGARQLLEIARGVISPGQGAPITAARATADVAAEDIIRGLKQDAQMSLYEKRQLDRLARITGPWENPDTAKAKLSVMGAALAGKAIRDVRILGPKPPEWAQKIAMQAQKAFEAEADLTVYTEDELAGAIRDGYISLEAGVAEFDRRKK